MLVQVHPATNMMRGDGEGYNLREISVSSLPGGVELLTGLFVDDGRTDQRPRRPNVPFWIAIPPGFQACQSLNVEIFEALRRRTDGVVISHRAQPDNVLVCPSCKSLVTIEHLPVLLPRSIGQTDRANCHQCGRAFSQAEIDTLGTWL